MGKKKLKPITLEELKSVKDTWFWMEKAAKTWGAPDWVWIPNSKDRPQPKSEIADGRIWIYDRKPADAVISLLYLTFEYKHDPQGLFRVGKFMESQIDLEDIDWSDAEIYD